MCAWAIALTVLGGLLEVTGFVLVMRELRRVQQEQFPDEPRLWDRTRAWVRRVLGRPQHATVHAAGASLSIGGGGALVAGGEVRVVPTDLEGRVAQLERDLLATRDDVTRHRQQLDARISGLHGEHDRRLVELEQRQREMEEVRKAGLRDAMRAERRATATFIVGVVLSTAGGVFGNV